MNKSILLLCCFLFAIQSFAQQTPQYTLYMLNPYSYNPAYAGLDNSLSATAQVRKQWLGLEESPLSQNVNAHLPWYYLSGAVGLSIDNDRLGAERNTSATVSYAFQQAVGNGRISVGISGGIHQLSIDGQKLRAPGGIYEGSTISHQDDFLSEGVMSDIVPTVGAGIYYQDERLDIGISSMHLTESQVSLETTSGTNLQLRRHYFATAAYRIDVNEDWEVRPSFLVKTDGTQFQSDISGMITYDENIFGGVSYRGYSAISSDAIAFFVGMQINENMRLAYAYDWTISGLNVVSQGSHELVFKYNLNKVIGAGKPPRIIYTPRYL